MSNAEPVVKEVTKTKIKEPKTFKVIIFNDDTTPMDFVVSVLVSIFNHTEKSATEIMLQIHNEGSGIAGVYNYEIAEQKLAETNSVIKEHKLELQVEIKSE